MRGTRPQVLSPVRVQAGPVFQANSTYNEIDPYKKVARCMCPASTAVIEHPLPIWLSLSPIWLWGLLPLSREPSGQSYSCMMYVRSSVVMCAFSTSISTSPLPRPLLCAGSVGAVCICTYLFYRLPPPPLISPSLLVVFYRPCWTKAMSQCLCRYR